MFLVLGSSQPIPDQSSFPKPKILQCLYSAPARVTEFFQDCLTGPDDKGQQMRSIHPIPRREQGSQSPNFSHGIYTLRCTWLTTVSLNRTPPTSLQSTASTPHQQTVRRIRTADWGQGVRSVIGNHMKQSAIRDTNIITLRTRHFQEN